MGEGFLHHYKYNGHKKHFYLFVNFCLNFRTKTRFVKHQISNVIEDDEI